ncbi:MAG: lipopolysaccharide biosynthesis protein [Labilithrix sp.]|nr:lipopolysaccharide biosynthesis protein [Labilithrix sp.]
MSAAPDKSRSRLTTVLNVVVSQTNTAIVMAGSFIVTPAILHGLGDAAYGGWLLINSLISYMRFLDLGTSAGTVKFGAGAHERGDWKDLARVLDTSAAVFGVLGLIALAGTLAMAWTVPRLYPNVAAGETVAILTLGGAIALDLTFRSFSATIRMRSLHFVHDAIEIVSYAIFKLGLVLYFAYTRTLTYGLLAILTLAEAGIRTVLVAAAALTLVPPSRSMNPFRAERAMGRKLAGMGIAITIITVSEVVRFQLDAAVIGYFMPESPLDISIFGVGTRLGSIAYTAIGVIGSVLMPRFSGLSETGDKQGLIKLLRKANLVTGLVASLVLVTIGVIGPQFLFLWLKKPWVETSGKILLIMLPAYYIGVLAGPSTSLLIGRGKLRGLTFLTTCEALLNLVLSVVLIKPLGIFGVTLGTAIPLVIFHGVAFPWLLKKEIGVTPGDYVRMNARAVLLGLAFLVAVGGLTFVPIPTYGRFILLGSLCVLVFTVLALVFIPEARAELRERLEKRRRRSAPDET